MKLGGGASGFGRYFPNKGSGTLLTSGKAVTILPLGGIFARRTYSRLILYVNSRGVSVVMRIDAVNLGNLVSKHLRQLQASSIYLGVLCVHKGLSKMEQDEVDIRHETVSSHGRRINLEKDVRPSHREYVSGNSHTRKPDLFKLRDITREKYASTASRLPGDARTIELKI